MLFNLMMIALLWRDTWLPHDTFIALLVFSLGGWLVSAYFLFLYLGLTTRQKIAGWTFFVAIVGFSVSRRFSSYSWYHNSWSTSLIWDVAGLAFIATSFGLVALFSKNVRGIGTSTAYTVESEAPDHVLHMGGTPNNSPKQSAAESSR